MVPSIEEVPRPETFLGDDGRSGDGSHMQQHPRLRRRHIDASSGIKLGRGGPVVRSQLRTLTAQSGALKGPVLDYGEVLNDLEDLV